MKANSPAVLHALEAIFDRQPREIPPSVRFSTDTVRVTSKTIQPEQFEALAALCQYLGQYPAIVNGGGYTTAVFNC